MSETSKRVSDILKPVLIENISRQLYVGLVGISGFGWIFGLPVISQVSRFIIERVVAWAVDNTAVGFSYLWIAYDAWAEVDDVERATERLKSMFNAPGKYSLEQMKDIENAFDDTAIAVIQLSVARL